jgi:hypothetical protein
MQDIMNAIRSTFVDKTILGLFFEPWRLMDASVCQRVIANNLSPPTFVLWCIPPCRRQTRLGIGQGLMDLIGPTRALNLSITSLVSTQSRHFTSFHPWFTLVHCSNGKSSHSLVFPSLSRHRAVPSCSAVRSNPVVLGLAWWVV